MLVLTRKKDQSVVINENIEITILDVQGDQVRLGINAPKEVSIYRKEIFIEIKQENEKAAAIKNIPLNDIFKKPKEEEK